ncbi:hypothetical protein H0H81_007195 [Sphagnurus paluster]|uniref:Uncharacterized protein n=1 Tax=Sphagnurus paluster TaxID=117069 RepID=A0A9P7KJB8_9AGAR|nr:hypothetical protein H0H81_007195 [Sphagnurus paluster]
MAQIQTARFPSNGNHGPLWDEEVVPALRKRLESESRTLAKRMSAVSLSSSQDNDYTNAGDSTSYTTAARDTPSTPFLQSNASTSASARPQQFQSELADRIPSSRAQNGIAPNSTTKSKPPSPSLSFQRSRTYSQPYPTDAPNGKHSRPNAHTNGNTNGKFSRMHDPRPTRIPQPATRISPALASGSMLPPPIPNGYHSANTTPDTQYPENDNGIVNGRRTPNGMRSTSTNTSASVTLPTYGGFGLLNEQPPFNPASAASSISRSQTSVYDNEDPPRPSMDSEERPFEHWYRGEVSRNGGVGELRVGRRQEMLEIANYGHTLRALERERREDAKGRKRADSVAGTGVLESRERQRQRESLYLNDEDARRVELVLDEAPLTDLEGSEGGHYYYESAYGDSREDEDTFEQHNESRRSEATNGSGTVSPPLIEQRASNETRSTTPTQRPSSRAASQASKIPARSRQSSESRVTTPTPTQIVRGASEPPPRSSSSSPAKAPSTPQVRQRQQSKPTPAGKVVAKNRMAAGKATRAKTLASKKEMEEEMKRRSVAHYPTPGEDGDETMIDAIPEWTQPVPRQGNWDDVVLPVVARKKGLDEHYEKADGKPTPRKVDNTIAPAPGTFGFDRSKYRPPRSDEGHDGIDEFGRPIPQPPVPIQEASEPPPIQQNPAPTPSLHDQMLLPIRTPPSPAPFSDYAPKIMEATILAPGNIPRPPPEQFHEEKVQDEGGCCKCIIM